LQLLDLVNASLTDQSEPISMLEALMIAKAVLPFASFKSLAASAVMEEVSFTPGAISMTTKLLMGPFLIETTLPGRTLRALSFIFCLLYLVIF